MRILRPKRHTQNGTETFLPEFPKRVEIKTETKTIPFYLGFFNGIERSGHSGRNGMILTTLNSPTFNKYSKLESHKIKHDLSNKMEGIAKFCLYSK